MPIVANSATRSKSVPLTLERKRDNEFVEFIIINILVRSNYLFCCPHTARCHVVIVYPLLGYSPLPGYSPLLGYSPIAGLHSLNHFVSHNFHVSSFGYIATFVLSVAIVW